ncbi:MAG TPA: VOC family protein [Steroidobacteraceae bacterium]|nr:VOC family protein [Steroidobacteraceae bacterium]
MLTKFSHVAICVRDLDVSVEFYRKLGFSKFFEFTDDSPITGAVLGIEMRKTRMAFMRLGDDPRQSFLDIVQFVDPPTHGAPYPTLNNVGICRVAFSVDDIDQTYEMLQTIGVEFVTPLQRFTNPDGDDFAMVCFKDPDGISLEIISGLNVERR